MVHIALFSAFILPTAKESRAFPLAPGNARHKETSNHRTKHKGSTDRSSRCIDKPLTKIKAIYLKSRTRRPSPTDKLQCAYGFITIHNLIALS